MTYPENKFKVGDLVLITHPSMHGDYGVIVKQGKVWTAGREGCSTNDEWLTLHLTNGTRITDFGYKFKRVAEC